MTQLQDRLQWVRRNILYLKRQLLTQEQEEEDLVTKIVLMAVANELKVPTSNTMEAENDKNFQSHDLR